MWQSAIESGSDAALRQAQTDLSVETRGPGFTAITRDVSGWLESLAAEDGLVTLFICHTSASLTIQENADPDVTRDLADGLDRLAPEDMPYRHTVEGPDDMPAHVKSMLTSTSLGIPVRGGGAMLGTWQGIYLIEHRARPHRRRVVLHYVGTISGSV